MLKKSPWETMKCERKGVERGRAGKTNTTSFGYASRAVFQVSDGIDGLKQERESSRLIWWVTEWSRGIN